MAEDLERLGIRLEKKEEIVRSKELDDQNRKDGSGEVRLAVARKMPRVGRVHQRKGN